AGTCRTRPKRGRARLRRKASTGVRIQGVSVAPGWGMLRSRSVRRAISLVFSWVCVLGSGCEERSAPPLSSLAPAPLSPLASAAPDGGADPPRLPSAPVWGSPLPTNAVRVTFSAGVARAGSAAASLGPDAGVAPLLPVIGKGPTLLVPDDAA